MAVKVVNELVTSTLSVEFTADSVVTKVNADRTPTMSVYKDSSLLFTKEGADVANATTGVYTSQWTPVATGEYEVVWTFIVNTVTYSQQEAVFVLDAAGTGLSPDDPTPDIGTANTCNVTGRFIDASGNYKKGVVVIFSPITVQAAHTSYGYIAGDASATSDATGQISMSITRNTYGLLTITGIGIVRRVTIPDQETVDVFELAAQGPDALAVQTPTYVTLPRRSP